MKKIIIVNGFPNSGKTELENLIAKYNYSIIRSSVDCVKEYAIKYFDWDGTKTEYWRRFLSQLKSMLVNEFDYIFLDLTKEVRKFYRDVNCEILMIDSREPEEIERFKNQFHAITLFVENNRCEKITSNESDANVKNYKYDYYIDNNGNLEDLEKLAIEFINKLK